MLPVKRLFICRNFDTKQKSPQKKITALEIFEQKLFFRHVWKMARCKFVCSLTIFFLPYSCFLGIKLYMIRKEIYSAFWQKNFQIPNSNGFLAVTWKLRKGMKFFDFRCTFLVLFHIFFHILLILMVVHKNLNTEKKNETLFDSIA